MSTCIFKVDFSYSSLCCLFLSGSPPPLLESVCRQYFVLAIKSGAIFAQICSPECCGRNRSRDLIYIRRVCQFVDICKHITLPKSYDVMAKSSEDRQLLCFSST